MTAQKVPGEAKLREYLERGLTQAQIVDAWREDAAEDVSRSAIGMAIKRYGLKSARPRPRYEDMLPWRVREEHLMHYDARMLRLEARRRRGQELKPDELSRLQYWRDELAQPRPNEGAPNGCVIYYDENSAEGFLWIPREPEHGDDLIDRTNVRTTVRPSRRKRR
jgi:hypothetical protein